MNLSIPICILTTDEQNFIWGDSQSAASPKWILHSDSEDLPQILLDFIELNTVVDFLLCASEESSESVNTFVSDGAGTQVVSLVLHWCDLSPLILSDIVFFHRA